MSNPALKADTLLQLELVERAALAPRDNSAEE
jgi:hypothetical protein